MLFAFLISSTVSCFNKNAQRSVRAYRIQRQSSSVRGREWCVLCSSGRSQFKHTELCFSTTPITLQNHLWNFIKRHITRKHPIAQDFPSDSAVENLPANAGEVGDMGSIPRLGRSPGGGMATHSNILAWKIPWTEESGQRWSTGPIGSQRVGCK